MIEPIATLQENAIVLLVAFPIVAALVPIVLGLLSDRTGWVVAAFISVVQAALALTVFRQVQATGPFSYEVGGFAPPFGIELIADGVSAPLLVLIAVTTLGVVGYAHRIGPHENEFYSELMLLMTGLSGLVATGDVFNLYVFLEITGLATYALVASGRSPEAALASLKYLLIGTIGASLYLFGVGYLYLATGTLNMADLSSSLASVGYGTPLVLTGFGLIVVGLSVKVALFPLHTWQPDAYAESPHAVSAYIAALVSTAAAYALFRLLYAVFTVDFFAAVPFAQDMLVLLASVSVVVGAVLAVMQSDLKRMLAYSSVSQFGIVVAALAIANETAILGSLVHLVGHAVMKAGLFLAVGVLATSLGARTVDEYAGIGYRAPVTSGAFAVLAFSLVGVPPAIGFAGKWTILLGAVEAGAWALTAVIVTSTLLTLAYFGRLVEKMYFTEPAADAAESVATDGGVEHDVSFAMRAIVVLVAVTAVALGIVATDLIATFEPVVEVYFA
ncbi:MAG: monovalent cation/H+ antiporter subunit D family protein [Halobacteriota archaeon]